MWIYHTFIHLFYFFVKIASLFHPKAEKWLKGRKQPFPTPQPNLTYIWFHCASLGEFEQGRNVIEALKKKYPEKKLLLTFFSPSGYEVRKNYTFADIVMYLPLDTQSNAIHFLETYRPEMGFFVKYDLWLNIIFEAKKRNIPLYLISARLNKNSNFFRFPLKKYYQKAFESFEAIFTQDLNTQTLLKSFCQTPNIFISGDTRYDRVYSNQQEWQAITALQFFLGEKYHPSEVMIVGSAWEAEIEMMLAIWEKLPNNFKLIFAPHEIHKTQINKYIARFPNESILFSEIQNSQPQHRILWIDNVGMLAKMYAYSSIAFVGGGFRRALHNILEPAAFGNVVLFGDNFYPEKYPEGVEIASHGGVFHIKNANDLEKILQLLIKDRNLSQRMGEANRSFILNRIGATTKILTYITKT